MSTEKNNVVRKRQDDINIKGEGNEVEETLITVSYNDLKESKKR
jgi:hypothetical protein